MQQYTCATLIPALCVFGYLVSAHVVTVQLVEYRSDDVTKNFFAFQHFEYHISEEHAESMCGLVEQRRTREH